MRCRRIVGAMRTALRVLELPLRNNSMCVGVGPPPQLRGPPAWHRGRVPAYRPLGSLQVIAGLRGMPTASERLRRAEPTRRRRQPSCRPTCNHQNPFVRKSMLGISVKIRGDITSSSRPSDNMARRWIEFCHSAETCEASDPRGNHQRPQCTVRRWLHPREHSGPRPSPVHRTPLTSCTRVWPSSHQGNRPLTAEGHS